MGDVDAAQVSVGPALTDEDVQRWTATANRILTGVGTVVLGQEAAVREAVVALLARGHVLLEGVPGTAKTLLVRTLSRLLGLTYRRIQFTPDLMPADITGTTLLVGAATFEFRAGPVFADLVLADEINRGPAKTQSALLEAMQERSVTVDGTTHMLPQAFTIFATQNPIEFEGTYPLPEAELDRFLVKVLLTHPAAQIEAGILTRVLGGFEADVPASYGVDRALSGEDLAALRAAVRRVRVEPSLVSYITALVRSTRDAPSLTMGASPRASIALLQTARALALVSGRGFVIPDDVKAMAPAVLRHRVAVAPELELEGVTADAALTALFAQVEAPR